MNNIGLVQHAKQALSEKWGYVWGTFGQVLTEALLTQKIKQYPDGVANYESFIRGHWMGRHVTDCVGLIKSYYWNGSYNVRTDVSADGMLSAAKEKGPISTMPEIPGICVQKVGHIGVYIGNGQVIEARGTKYGVIQSPLKGPGASAWTNWLKCPFIDYSSNAAPAPSTPGTSSGSYDFKTLQRLINVAQDNIPGPITLSHCPLIKLGAKGEVVRWIQNRLNSLGFNCSTADGDFGGKTYAAVVAFQKSKGLAADGIIGQGTWRKLLDL